MAKKRKGHMYGPPTTDPPPLPPEPPPPPKKGEERGAKSEERRAKGEGREDEARGLSPLSDALLEVTGLRDYEEAVLEAARAGSGLGETKDIDRCRACRFWEPLRTVEADGYTVSTQPPEDGRCKPGPPTVFSAMGISPAGSSWAVTAAGELACGTFEPRNDE